MWVKGKSGNPNGRPAIIPKELMSALNKNKAAVKELILTYLNLTQAEIDIRQRDQNIPVFELMLGKVIERIVNEGDVFRMRALLEIVIGKLPEEQDPHHLTDDEKKLIERYRERIEHKPNDP